MAGTKAVNDGGGKLTNSSNKSNNSSSSKLNTATSIVDYLKSQGEDSSLSARKQLAKELGISNYTGTAAQNTKMLNMLKNPSKTTTNNKATTNNKNTNKDKGTTNNKNTNKDKGTTNNKPTPTNNKPTTATPSATDKAKLNGGTTGAIVDTASVDDYVNTYKNSVGEEPDYYADMEQYMQTTMDAPRPVLKTADELAKAYGIDYNYDNILNTLMNGVKAQYDLEYAKQADSEGKYYSNAATAQNTLTDTLDQMRTQAITAGANKGMQSANALSAMLGTSQQFADSATQLAQDRANLAKEYGSSTAKANQTAMDTYNALGQYLSNLARDIYSSDMTGYTSQLDYNSQIGVNNANMTNQAQAATSAWDTAMQAALDSLMSGYTATQGTLAASREASDATRYNADQNLAAQKVASDATKYAADQNLAASNNYNNKSNTSTAVEDLMNAINTGILGNATTKTPYTATSDTTNKNVSTTYPAVTLDKKLDGLTTPQKLYTVYNNGMTYNGKTVLPGMLQAKKIPTYTRPTSGVASYLSGISDSTLPLIWK